MTIPLVPSRIRQLITVESGLNDGIATPVVMLAIAGAAATAGLEHAEGAGGTALELVLGVAVGVIVGGAGGTALRWARRHGLAAESFAGIAVLALGLLSYACALVLDGNGFVAAFCGGLAFGAFAGRAHRPSCSSSSRRAPCSRRRCGWPSEPSPSPSRSTASTPRPSSTPS